MLKITNPAELTTLQYKLSLLYCGVSGISLSWGFLGLSLYLSVCDCLVCLSEVNVMPLGSKDRRNYRLCKKIRKATLKTGSHG